MYINNPMKFRINFSYVNEIDLEPILAAFKDTIPDLIDYFKNTSIIQENGVIEIEYSHSHSELELQLREKLKACSNLQYVVTVDIENDNTITLLKPNDLEQLGIYICDFCGAVSSSEQEKYIHERAHYFY